MASSALIRGARDVARARMTDPYKFSAWIRSMWYNLDKLDDRRYNERMARISSAARMQENNNKRLQDIRKQDVNDQEKLLNSTSSLTSGMPTNHKNNIQGFVDYNWNMNRQHSKTKTMYSPNSMEHRNASLGQEEIIENIGSVSTIYKNYAGHTAELWDAIESGEISRVHDYDIPVYMRMINSDKHTIHIIADEKGKPSMAFTFENPPDDVKGFLPTLKDNQGNELKDPDGNKVYGITWNDYIKQYGDWNMKNKGKAGDMDAHYAKLLGWTRNGKMDSNMYKHDAAGVMKIVDEFHFTSKYPFDIPFSQPKTLANGDEINKNELTNFQTAAFDYDIDGSGGPAPTLAESTEAADIQIHYLKWLESHPENFDKISRLQRIYPELGNELMGNLQESQPLWILDDDFASGYVEIPDVYGTEFAGKDLLQHVMNIHYGKAAYDALLPHANDFMNKKNAEIRAKAIKAAKGKDTVDVDKKAIALQELKTKYNSQFDQLKPLFSYANNHGAQDSQYNFVSDPKLRDKLFSELMPSNTASGNPIEIKPLIKNGKRVHGGYSIWVEGVQNNIRGTYPKGEFNVMDPPSMKILWKYLFDDDTYSGVWPAEWQEFLEAQERPRADK